MSYIFVYTTYAEEKDAVATARYVIEQRLASCANLFPKGRSLYEWKGEVADTPETIMILKTKQEQWEALRNAIEKTHPYEIPCIIALPMMDMNKAFAGWMDGQVGP